jgi:hypothetical protein
MMSEFYEEINAYRRPNESNRKFAGRLGVHPSMLRYWEGGMVPKEETITRIAQSLKLDKKIRDDWIAWANRAAHEDETPNPPARRANLNVVMLNSPETRIIQEDQSNDTFVAVPCAKSSLDNGELVLSSRNAWFMFRRDWINSVGSDATKMFLKVVWQKDVEGLKPGDVVLVDMGRIGIKDGAIYAIDLNGVIVLRVVSVLQCGRIRVSSNHTNILEGFPGEDIRIIGEAIWVGRTF